MDSKIAMMIDSENVGYQYIEEIIKETSKYGKLVISRFYGDISSLSKQWKEKAVNLAIKPVHQYNVASGKNAADMEMALDAIELMYQSKADTFFIVSSDSDFTPLAIRLKELGAIVVGVGDEKKATKAFVSACSEFKYFQYFDTDEEEEEKSQSADDIQRVISNIIIENGENNQLQLSRLGDILVNQNSDFDPRKYGSSSLSMLVNKLGFTTYTDKKATFIRYENELSIDKLKQHIDTFLGKKKQGVISQLKQSIEKEYPSFSVKSYGFSKMSVLLKSLGYSINLNTFKRL